jgi:hypothetical protein
MEWLPGVNHGQSQRPGCPVTQFGLTSPNPAVILTTKVELFGADFNVPRRLDRSAI